MQLSDRWFKNPLPDFLRKNAGRTAERRKCRMSDVRNAGSAECRKNTGSAERRENVGRTPEAQKNTAQREKMAKKNRKNTAQRVSE